MKLSEYLKSDFNAKGFMSKLNHDEEMREELKRETSFLGNNASVSEMAYCYYHGLTSAPICPVCGEKKRFSKFNVGYFQTCGIMACKRSRMSMSNVGKDFKKIV